MTVVLYSHTACFRDVGAGETVDPGLVSETEVSVPRLGPKRYRPRPGDSVAGIVSGLGPL